MTLSVTHSTLADASFSASGQAAWDDTHVVSGLAAVATSGSYADLSGTPTIITLSQVYPVGSVYIETTGTNPATTFGFGTWALFAKGQTLFGFSTGSAEFGTAGQTGGATGLSVTPSGTNATVSFTPSGTLDLGLYRANGTLSTSAVTGSVSVEWPTGVPTFSGTASGATVSASVNWPAGVPTFAGTSHQHGLPMFSTGATGISFASAATWGLGTSINGNIRVSATATGPIVIGPGAGASVGTGSVYLSQSATAGGVISWPASVPQVVASGSAAGVIAWPATAPSAVAKTLTAAAQIFTGATGSGSAIFTGVAGTIPAQTFNGIARTLDKLPPYIVTFMWQRTA